MAAGTFGPADTLRATVPRPPDIWELARQGVALVVATCGADGRPAVARGWGPHLADDGDRLTLCVDAPPGSATLQNLLAGSAIAATMSRPSTYSTVQLKGLLRAVRAPNAGEVDRVNAHLDAFAIETAGLGLDQTRARRLLGNALVTVVVDVAERYDQTPRPGAGAPM